MSSLSKVYAAELEGIEARLVEVETDLNVGLHSFMVVGLGDKALSEARERVSAALKNSGFKAPNRENRKIVVNLAPADVHKTGTHYDVAIALGFLIATEQIKKFDPARKIFIGELSLTGELRPVPGALNVARLAQRLGYRELYLPVANAVEAALVRTVNIIPVKSMAQLIEHLEGRKEIKPQPTTTWDSSEQPLSAITLDDIKGQEAAKRALIIAAAGGHNMFMTGSPGGGKTMLAQALISILPPLVTDEIIEVTQVYSAAGLLGQRSHINQRPFRSPHQTASPAAVIGGGTNPRPGEISLAHRGVLFLDEAPEFRRDLLESLRQPIEHGHIIVSRMRNNLIFPAKFMLILAMNPCPCGYANSDTNACRCSAHEVYRYQKKVSGPLLDRIDIQITVPRVAIADLSAKKNSDRQLNNEKYRAAVITARERQYRRLGGHRSNAEMTSKECDALLTLEPAAQSFIDKTMTKSMLSARGYYRVLKTAQTIADLDNSDVIKHAHLAEAFGYRLREHDGV